MIAESTASTHASPTASLQNKPLQADLPGQARPELSLSGVVANLQLLLATRRAARNADYAY